MPKCFPIRKTAAMASADYVLPTEVPSEAKCLPCQGQLKQDSHHRTKEREGGGGGGVSSSLM